MLGAEPVVVAEPLDWEFLDAEFAIDPGKAEKIEFRVRDLQFQYDVKERKLTGASLRNATVGRTAEGKLTMRIVLDRGSMDVVLNNGEVYSMAPCPNRADKPVLTCSAKGGEASVGEVKAYQLRSIWEK